MAYVELNRHSARDVSFRHMKRLRSTFRHPRGEGLSHAGRRTSHVERSKTLTAPKHGCEASRAKPER